MTGLRQPRSEQWPMKKRRGFGRGTIFLLISLVVIGGWRLLYQPKVTIERQVDTGGQIEIKRSPALSVLLSWSKDLSLQKTQEVSLKKLRQEEQVQLKPLEDEIGKVMHKFNQFATLRQGKSNGLQEFQAAAQPIAELSRKKRLVEQSFAERGLGILDETQKQKTSQLWDLKLARIRAGKKEVANP